MSRNRPLLVLATALALGACGKPAPSPTSALRPAAVERTVTETAADLSWFAGLDTSALPKTASQPTDGVHRLRLRIGVRTDEEPVDGASADECQTSYIFYDLVLASRVLEDGRVRHDIEQADIRITPTLMPWGGKVASELAGVSLVESRTPNGATVEPDAKVPPAMRFVFEDLLGTFRRFALPALLAAPGGPVPPKLVAHWPKTASGVETTVTTAVKAGAAAGVFDLERVVAQAGPLPEGDARLKATGQGAGRLRVGPDGVVEAYRERLRLEAVVTAATTSITRRLEIVSELGPHVVDAP